MSIAVNGKKVPEQYVVQRWRNYQDEYSITTSFSPELTNDENRTILPCCPKCENSWYSEEADRSIEIVEKWSGSGYDFKCLCCGEVWHCYHPDMYSVRLGPKFTIENCIWVSQEFDVLDASQYIPIEASMC